MYTYTAIACDIVNLVCIYPVGFLVDKVPSKIMLPISYLVCGLSCGLYYFIKMPDTVLSFVVWCTFNFCFLFQIVSLENYFSRNVAKEVRGILFGFFYMSA